MAEWFLTPEEEIIIWKALDHIYESDLYQEADKEITLQLRNEFAPNDGPRDRTDKNHDS